MLKKASRDVPDANVGNMKPEGRTVTSRGSKAEK